MATTETARAPKVAKPPKAAPPPEPVEMPAPPKAAASTAVVPSANLPANVTDQAWGSEGLDLADVKIPKLLLMQPTSELVAAGKANVGEIIRSTTGEVVVPRGQSVRIIPLLSRKTWRIMEKEGEKFEWRRNEPCTEENKNRKFTWTDPETKTEWRADRTLGFFCLLPGDIEREVAALEGATGDLTAALIPVLLEFTRSSYGAGRDLATHFATARMAKKPPASWGLLLGAETKKNDKGTFQIFTITKGEKTPELSLKKAHEWYTIVRGGDVVIDEGADTDDVIGVAHTEVPAAEAGDKY